MSTTVSIPLRWEVTAILLICAAPATAQVECADWGTESFFRQVTAEQVTRCMEAGVEVGAADAFGSTWLHVAVRASRDSAVIAALANAGANVNARDRSGRTPLHEAAAHSRYRWIVAALVAAGADLEARDREGNTPLHASLESRSSGMAGRLLELGADPTARNDQGRVARPTHCENWSTGAFAHLADAADVAACIESGWDVNVRNAEGNTPLHQAVAVEDTAKIAALLEAGADPDLANNRGATALRIAIADNASWVRMVPVVVSDSGGVDQPDTIPQRYVVLDHASIIVALLLDAGADPNTRDGMYRGYPLHWASRRRGDPRIIEALLRAGAEVDARDERGATPLHVAAGDDRGAGITASLLDAGADIGALDQDGRTPLHAAAARGTTEAIAALLAAGAELSARDTDGNTPLHASWTNSNPEVIRTLLQLGADPAARNNEGQPTDPWNCENLSTRAFGRLGDADDVAKCVDAGLDTDSRDRYGAVPQR